MLTWRGRTSNRTRSGETGSAADCAEGHGILDSLGPGSETAAVAAVRSMIRSPPPTCGALVMIDGARSSYFEDPRRFPPGSIDFDCALLMRSIPHEWERA